MDAEELDEARGLAYAAVGNNWDQCPAVAIGDANGEQLIHVVRIVRIVQIKGTKRQRWNLILSSTAVCPSFAPSPHVWLRYRVVLSPSSASSAVFEPGG